MARDEVVQAPRLEHRDLVGCGLLLKRSTFAARGARPALARLRGEVAHGLHAHLIAYGARVGGDEGEARGDVRAQVLMHLALEIELPRTCGLWDLWQVRAEGTERGDSGVALGARTNLRHAALVRGRARSTNGPRHGHRHLCCLQGAPLGRDEQRSSVQRPSEGLQVARRQVSDDRAPELRLEAVPCFRHHSPARGSLEGREHECVSTVEASHL
mmetsp:Transcript_22621/g.61240  ORF Transcript_22621/g.61240 Transcript_22621/m.61240 type:complete len:214 (-) Transcript_22621:214-855(-)